MKCHFGALESLQLWHPDEPYNRTCVAVGLCKRSDIILSTTHLHENCWFPWPSRCLFIAKPVDAPRSQADAYLVSVWSGLCLIWPQAMSCRPYIHFIHRIQNQLLISEKSLSFFYFFHTVQHFFIWDLNTVTINFPNILIKIFPDYNIWNHLYYCINWLVWEKIIKIAFNLLLQRSYNDERCLADFRVVYPSDYATVNPRH